MIPQLIPGGAQVHSVDHGENDLLQAQIVDQVLAAKMTLINDVSVVRCDIELGKTNGLTVWLPLPPRPSTR